MIRQYKIFSIVIMSVCFHGFHDVYAMEKINNGCNVYVGYDLKRREYFARPLAPHYFHVHGLSCPGHEGQTNFEEIRSTVASLEQSIASVASDQDLRNYAQQLQRQQFLASYLNCVCLSSQCECNENKRIIECASTMLKLVPKWHDSVLQEALYASIFSEILHKFKALVVAGQIKPSFNDISSFRILSSAIQCDSDGDLVKVLQSRKDLESKFAYAQCLLEGNGIKKNVDDAVKIFASILVHKKCPEDIQECCLKLLKIQSSQGSCIATCELILALATNPKKVNELYELFDMIYAKQEIEQETYIKMLSQEAYYNRLKKVAQVGKGRCFLLCAFVAAYRAKTTQEIQVKKSMISELVAYFNLIKDASELQEFVVQLPFIIAKLYEEVGEQNHAIKFYKIGVSHNDLDCMCELGLLYVADTGKESIFEQGIEMISRAATNGLTPAQMFLANFYCGFITLKNKKASIKTDYALAYKYACMASESDPKNKEAQCLLGHILYEHGGKNGIPVNEDKAYALLEQVYQARGSLELIHYVFLGNTCYKKKEYEKARTWFEKAQALEIAKFFMAVIDLILEDQGTRCDRHKCYDVIEYRLSEVFTPSSDQLTQYRGTADTDILVSLLKKHSDSNDERAKIILSRLVCGVEKDNLFGIAKADSVDYLKEMALNGNASAAQFLGSLYLRGILVEQSYERALEYLLPIIKDSAAPGHIVAFATKDMIEIANKATGKPAIIAALTMVPTVVKYNDSKASDLVYFLIDKAEAETLRLASSDTDLNNLFFTSGAFGAACNYAKASSPQLAYLLGYTLLLRFTHTLGDFETASTKGFDLLEYFYSQDKIKENATKLAKQYTRVAQYCMTLSPCHSEDIKRFLMRANELDPEFSDAQEALIVFYQAGLDQHVDKATSLKTASELHEKFADQGNETAMIEVAVEYLEKIHLNTATSGQLAKCVHYLRTAAERGNYYALFLLSSGSLTPHVRQLKPILQEIVKKIVATTPNPLKTDKLFCKALQAMINQNWDLAGSTFEQLSEKYNQPRLLLISANIQSVAQNDYWHAIELIAKALKGAAVQGKKLDDACSRFVLQGVLTVLQYQARKQPELSPLVGILGATYKSFGYTGMRPISE